MANEKVSAVILQTDEGYYRHALPVGLAISLADVTVTQAGKTYDYPRADYVPPPPPAVTPGKPTLAWIQKYPIGTDSKFTIPVGYFVPGGTVGPYLIGVNDPSGKYRLNVDANGFVLRTSEVAVGAATDTLTAYVIDGRGNQSDLISFTILKSDQNGAGINTPLALPTFAPIWNGRLRTDAAPLFTVGAHGPGHLDTRQDGVGVVDPKGIWTGSGPNIWSPRGLPPVGDYPVAVSVTNKASGVTTSVNETLSIVPVPPIVAEFIQTAVWTDQTPPGTDIGLLAATVPDNSPQFASRVPHLTVTAARRVLTVSNPPVGDFAFGYTVMSGGTALSKEFSATIPVRQGVALEPGNLVLALNALDNATPGQKVGTLSVKGRAGGSYVILSQSGFNPMATTGQWGNPARYQLSGNAIITPPNCLLSYQDPACGWEDDKLQVVWTSDDGLTTCQNTFPIPVKDAAQTTTLAATDKISLHAANVASNHPHAAKYQVNVAYNPDPDAYTDATRGDDTKIGWVGPTVLNFLPGPKGEPPRLGGAADNTGISSGVTSYGKGYWIASDGDVRLQGAAITSGVHGGSSSDGKEGYRKDGNTWGNGVILDHQFIDCDQGIETGVNHGYLYARNVSVRRCGGASVGSGLTHGLYVGTMSRFTIEDSYIDGSLYGHLLKCRAREIIIRRCVLIDNGSAACCVDLPNGGKALIEDCLIVKGPFAANPSAVNYGAEVTDAPQLWPENVLTLNRNTILLMGISYGGNYGPLAVVTHYHIPGRVPSLVQGTDNQIWLPPMGQVSAEMTNYAALGSTRLTNTTILKLPPKIPVRPSLMTRPHRRRAILEASPFPNFADVPVLVDNPFPYVTAPGLVATMTPTQDLEVGADAFAVGFTSSLVRDTVYGHSGNPDPWAPDGAFTLNGGALTYNGGIQPGVYHVQPQFVSTDGRTVANHRVAVTVR